MRGLRVSRCSAPYRPLASDTACLGLLLYFARRSDVSEAYKRPPVGAATRPTLVLQGLPERSPSAAGVRIRVQPNRLRVRDSDDLPFGDKMRLRSLRSLPSPRNRSSSREPSRNLAARLPTIVTPAELWMGQALEALRSSATTVWKDVRKHP